MIKPHDVITEDTRVKLKWSTVWGIVVSVVGSAVWLTVLVMQLHHENELAHAKLMLGIEALNSRSVSWVTHAQLEDSLMIVASELHPADTNLNYWKELQMRQAIRGRLQKSP